jgi:hypothetical protein
MSNNPAGPTLAEETIVDRKGEDIRDRQVPEALHFRRGPRSEPPEKADTTVTFNPPDGPFLVESKEDQAPSLAEALGRKPDDQNDDAAMD